MSEYVYLLGIIYPFGELYIMGIYTDEKLLVKAYDKLLEEDARCTTSEYPEVPQIYKIPINKFLGEKTEWAEIEGEPYFYEEDNIETISIDKIKSHIRIASFYGMNVYCDLNFEKGAYVDLEYVGGAEIVCIRMSIEDGSFDTTYNYMQNTLKSWYKDNKKYLMEIYNTRKIIDIPEW